MTNKEMYFAQTKLMIQKLRESLLNTYLGDEAISCLSHFAHYNDSYDDKNYDDGYDAYEVKNYDDYVDYTRYENSNYDDSNDKYYD